MIKNFIFDWSGVCTTIGMSNPMCDFLSKKLNKDQKEIKKAFKSIEDPYVKGVISGEKFLEEILQELHIQTKDIRTLTDALIAEPPINKPILTLVKQLHTKYKTILFSDSFKEMAHYINSKYSLHTLFDYLIYSHKLHLRKPDPAIYEKLIRLTSIIPEESIFIDDREENIETAKKFGLNTILYSSIENLLQDLDNYTLNLMR